MEINPNLLIIIAVAAIVGFVLISFLRPADSKPEKASRASKHAEAQPVAAATSSTAAEPSASKPKKKKNRSKKSKKGSDESDTGAESAPEKKEAVKFEEPNKKADKKGAKAAPAVAPSALKKPEPAKVEESDSDSDSSSDEEEVRKPVAAKKTTPAIVAAAKRAAAVDDVAPPTFVQNHFDGWNVVEEKRKSKPKKVEEVVSPVVEKKAAVVIAEPEPESPPAPVIETITAEVKVEAKKLGLLIGPKGVTRIAIQNATGTNIQMPKADKETTGPVAISVSGPELGVRKAIQALNELCAKGYCGLLAPDDFQESYVAVNPKYLKDIIGPKGDVIKKLGQHTGVKITVPETLKTPGPDGKVSKVKIGLTGQKEKVALARTLIKDITKYFHTPVTHPGIVHVDMDIPSNYYNFIIGAKGAEIKNIQNTHKVSVHIPDEEAANPNVVVVGEPNNVAQAKAHIEKLITRVDERAAAAAAAKAEAAGVSAAAAAAAPVSPVQVAPATAGGATIGATVGGGPGWNTNTRKAPKVAEEVEEEWVKEFAPQSSINIDITSIISDNHKFAPAVVPSVAAPTQSIPAPVERKLAAPSSAWNNLSGLSAENWN